MCVFHAGSDQILAVETTWERGYVCTVYALGCDLASCSFPRDFDVQTYYYMATTPATMSGPHSRQVEVHMAYTAIDQLSSARWHQCYCKFPYALQGWAHPTAWAQCCSGTSALTPPKPGGTLGPTLSAP